MEFSATWTMLLHKTSSYHVSNSLIQFCAEIALSLFYVSHNVCVEWSFLHSGSQLYTIKLSICGEILQLLAAIACLCENTSVKLNSGTEV